MVQASLHFGQQPKGVMVVSSTGGEVCNQRLVEECHLLGCRCLEYLEPSGHCVSFYGWLFHATVLNPVEEDIRRRRDIMQLNGCAKGSGSKPQGIPLGPSPGAPFDDYSKAECEEFLTQLPLQRLDLAAPFFVPDVEGKSIHPLIGTETNRAEPAFKHLGKRGLTRTRQPAHNNQSRSGTGYFHE